MHFLDKNLLKNTDPILTNIHLLCHSLKITSNAQMLNATIEPSIKDKI